jgi:hypothetical protein
MFSRKLFVIIFLVGSLLTAGALQIKPTVAINKQDFKKQLLDKILSCKTREVEDSTKS